MGQPSRLQSDYEKDFAAWADSQARLLRSRILGRADLDNIAEELEGLSRAERRKLRSCLTLIIAHMLKLVYQPERAFRSWRNTIQRERRNFERLLQESPSLKAYLPELFLQAYEDGREAASDETGLDVSVFPKDPAFDLDQVKARDFMPLGRFVDGQEQSSDALPE